MRKSWLSGGDQKQSKKKKLLSTHRQIPLGTSTLRYSCDTATRAMLLTILMDFRRSYGALLLKQNIKSRWETASDVQLFANT